MPTVAFIRSPSSGSVSDLADLTPLGRAAVVAAQLDLQTVANYGQHLRRHAGTIPALICLAEGADPIERLLQGVSTAEAFDPARSTTPTAPVFYETIAQDRRTSIAAG